MHTVPLQPHLKRAIYPRLLSDHPAYITQSLVASWTPSHTGNNRKHALTAPPPSESRRSGFSPGHTDLWRYHICGRIRSHEYSHRHHERWRISRERHYQRRGERFQPGTLRPSRASPRRRDVSMQWHVGPLAGYGARVATLQRRISLTQHGSVTRSILLIEIAGHRRCRIGLHRGYIRRTSWRRVFRNRCHEYRRQSGNDRHFWS